MSKYGWMAYFGSIALALLVTMVIVQFSNVFVILLLCIIAGTGIGLGVCAFLDKYDKRGS